MREGSVLAISYAIAWILFFLVLLKKYKKESLSVFVVAFYVLYSVLAVFLYNNSYYGSDYNKVELLPYIYLFVAIAITLRPIIKFDKAQVSGLVQPNQLWINRFAYGLIFLALFLLPSAVLDLQNGITLLLLNPSGGSDLYTDAHGLEIAKKSIADIPRFVFYMFSDIGVLVFFYFLTQKNINKKILLGLSVCMIYNILRPISLGLRTDAVMTLFSISAGYMLMRRWIPKQRRRIATIVGSTIGGLFISLLVILTLSRFSNRSEGAMGENLSYIAQSSLNFNNYGLDAGGIRYGDRTLRIYKEILGFENVPSGIVDRRNKYSKMKMNDSVFYTYVGDFTLDFGPFAAVIILILMSCALTSITRVRMGVISFSQLLVIFLALLIPLQGGMYLFTFSDGGNYTLAAFAFCAIFFNIVSGNKQNIILRDSL